MKNKVLGYFILLVIILSSCAKGEEVSENSSNKYLSFDRLSPVLKLNISFKQQSYHVGETIRADISLINIGNEELIVKERMIDDNLEIWEAFHDITLFIYPPSGGLLAYICNNFSNNLSEDDFVALLPGENITHSHDLNCYHIEEYGYYSVRVIYFNSFDPGDGRIAWKGMLVSNSASFQYIP